MRPSQLPRSHFEPEVLHRLGQTDFNRYMYVTVLLIFLFGQNKLGKKNLIVCNLTYKQRKKKSEIKQFNSQSREGSWMR